MHESYDIGYCCRESCKMIRELDINLTKSSPGFGYQELTGGMPSSIHF